MEAHMSKKSAAKTAKPKPEQDEKGRFLPGNNGGPGRPKGSRPKLAEAFWADLYQAWQANGIDAIDRMIAEKPGDFVRVVATQMPKELNVNNNPLSDLTDDELADAIAIIKASLGGPEKGEDETDETTKH